MRGKTTVFFALVVVILAGFFAFQFITKQKPPDKEADENSEDPSLHSDDEKTAALEKRLDSVQQRVNRVAADQARLEDGQNQNAEEIDEIVERLEEQDPDRQKDMQMNDPSERDVAGERQAALLELKMIEQGVDPSWSKTTENDISEKIEKHTLPNLVTDHVECSASICRVSLDFGSRENAEKILQENFDQITTLTKWDTSGFFRINEKDQLNLYYPREGYELPVAE